MNWIIGLGSAFVVAFAFAFGAYLLERRYPGLISQEDDEELDGA